MMWLGVTLGIAIFWLAFWVIAEMLSMIDK